MKNKLNAAASMLVAATLLPAATGLPPAQAVTIGGTPSEAQATGLTAMFAGDRFENFRHMDRFVPTSEMSASPDPWELGDSRDSLTFTGDFLGEAKSLDEFIALSDTSALLGIALGEGRIDSLDDPIRKYLPELTSATFDGVTVKHVLQMSSGVRFTEVYTDPESDINRMTTLVPPMTYLEYINTLGREHEPGTYNHYASINT